MNFLDRSGTAGPSVRPCQSFLHFPPTTQLTLTAVFDVIATKRARDSCSWRLKTVGPLANGCNRGWTKSGFGCKPCVWLMRSELMLLVGSWKLHAARCTAGLALSRRMGLPAWLTLLEDRIDFGSQSQLGWTWSSSRSVSTPTGTQSPSPLR